MRYVQNKNLNPYFNLALEEYVLKNFEEDFFLIWRNPNAIIVGRHQNTYSEINLDYVEKHGLPVVRRLSGGGSVYHDLGNLNFTFIMKNDKKRSSSFQDFTKPIIEVLQSLSVDAKFTGRNDLTIEGRKFSGNAQYHYKDRTLHHGTILFSSNMADLSGALKHKEGKFKDKSVKSVQSRVTNISDHLKEPLTIEAFQEKIMDHIMHQYGKDHLYSLTPDDIEAVNQLVRDKYSTWDWNFGKSPTYDFVTEHKFPGGLIEIHMNVSQGKIKDLQLYGDFFAKRDIQPIIDALIGADHEQEALGRRLAPFTFEDYFINLSKEELIFAFFS